MISICSLLGAQIGSAFKPGENFYFTLTRVWELLLGSVSALVSEKFRSNKILTDFGFLLICIGFFSFGPTTPTPSVFILLPTIGCALIIIFKSKKSITHKILEYKYMVFIGLLSYSLYLWHYPLFSFFQIMKGGVPSIIELTFLLILSFGLSYLSWKYIEQPFRKPNNLISKSRTHVFLSSTVLSFLILSFALIGRLDNGYEVRLPIDQRSDAIFQQEDIFRFVRTTGNDSCTKYLDLDLLFEEVCISNSKEPKILIAGDSKAMSLYAPIYSNQFKVDAILIAAHGCPLYPNLSYVPTFETGFSNNCTEIAKKVIDIATNLSSIETIILFNEADNLNGDLSKYYLNGQKLNKVEAFNHAYSFVLSKLNKTGKKIIVVSDNPSWSVDPKKCIQKLPLSKAPADSCRINVEVFKEGLAGYFQELEELKKTYPNVVNYDPTRVLCDKNGSCDIREDNKLLYFDQTHMSPFAALKVLNAISNDGYLQY
jgi:hypothetical protein